MEGCRWFCMRQRKQISGDTEAQRRRALLLAIGQLQGSTDFLSRNGCDSEARPRGRLVV